MNVNNGIGVGRAAKHKKKNNNNKEKNILIN
jgi:hypothetical protein